MKIIVSIACLALAGCGGSPPVPTTPSAPAADTQPAVAPEPEAKAEATSAPTLTLEGDGISAPLLPAVSDDGSKVALLEEYEEGMSGETVTNLVIQDVASGRRSKEIMLHESETDGTLDESKDAVTARLEEANKFLSGATWLAMKTAGKSGDEFANCPQEDDVCIQKFTLGSVSVRYVEPTLTINGKATKVEEWSDKGYCTYPEDLKPDDEDCEMSCWAPVFISMTAVDSSEKYLLFEVHHPYFVDGCEELAVQYRVVEVE